jgi:hypothetical protein
MVILVLWIRMLMCGIFYWSSIIKILSNWLLHANLLHQFLAELVTHTRLLNGSKPSWFGNSGRNPVRFQTVKMERTWDIIKHL